MSRGLAYVGRSARIEEAEVERAQLERRIARLDEKAELLKRALEVEKTRLQEAGENV